MLLHIRYFNKLVQIVRKNFTSFDTRVGWNMRKCKPVYGQVKLVNFIHKQHSITIFYFDACQNIKMSYLFVHTTFHSTSTQQSNGSQDQKWTHLSHKLIHHAAKRSTSFSIWQRQVIGSSYSKNTGVKRDNSNVHCLNARALCFSLKIVLYSFF